MTEYLGIDQVFQAIYDHQMTEREFEKWCEECHTESWNEGYQEGQGDPYE